MRDLTTVFACKVTYNGKSFTYILGNSKKFILGNQRKGTERKEENCEKERHSPSRSQNPIKQLEKKFNQISPTL
eukprot:snap_masked-scaffold_1-processed-gene-17.41-mRNA-1 protein AED:0.65 eAED:1.00 QI:0/0/0/0.33/1/1/3/0/73